MNETYRVDALRDLAASNREHAAEMRKSREEMAAWRTEIHASSDNVVAAVGGAVQWSGIGIIIGMLLMLVISKKAKPA